MCVLWHSYEYICKFAFMVVAIISLCLQCKYEELQFQILYFMAGMFLMEGREVGIVWVCVLIQLFKFLSILNAVLTV
jgi:hypothetical protein